MKRSLRVLALACVAFVFCSASWESKAHASGCSDSVGYSMDWDGAYGITLSSFVAGCSSGTSTRAWNVYRWQEAISPYRACAPGRWCDWVRISDGSIVAARMGVPDGLSYEHFYCWSGHGGFIGTTQYYATFSWKDDVFGSPQQGPVWTPAKTMC